MLGVLGSPYVAGLLLGAVASLGLGAYAWRRKATPARVPFVALTLTTAAWLTLYAVESGGPPGTPRVALEGTALVVGTLLGVWWLLFGLAYAGHQAYVTAGTAAVLSAPVVGLGVLIAVDPTGSALWTAETVTVGRITTVKTTAVTPLFGVVVLYSYATIGVGFALVFRRAIQSGSLYTAQVGWMAVTSVPTVVAGALDTFGLSPVPGIQVVPYTIPVLMFGYAVALFRHGMSEMTPSTGHAGRDAVLRDLADPVVVTDGNGRVADLNPASERTFGVKADQVVGRDLRTVVGAEEGTTLVDGTSLTLTTADGPRRFEVSASTVGDDRRTLGRALVLRDVTRRRLREQRLDVLNRVVRHNLRNDMNAVMGYADLAETGDDGTPAGEYLGEIAAVADDLVDLGKKAHDLEQTVARESTARPADIRETVDHVLGRLDTGSATVSVDVPADLAVVTDGAVLELVVHEAIENAIEHGGEAPNVAIAAGETDDGVRVVVEDDGPGLPPQERRTVAAGEEIPLEHGSGLGLWIVAWGVQWLGGELHLDCRDGTAITVSVPDHPVGTVPDPIVDSVTLAEGVPGADGGHADPTADSDGSTTDDPAANERDESAPVSPADSDSPGAD